MEITLEELNSARKRGLRPVAVGCIIHDEKVLFVYKNKYRLWQLPQGGIDNKETIELAIRREMGEELGVEFADSLFGFKVVARDRIDFPTETQGTRELTTDDGEEVFMRGKRYFFIVAETNMREIEIKEAEFDNYRWMNAAESQKTAGEIYQKGKRRITEKIIKVLTRREFIK